MPTGQLPENPSLEHLKSQAKLVRDLIRSGDDGALNMVDEFHPRLRADDLDDRSREGFKTTEAQLIVARMYGFESWPALRRHLDIVSNHTFDPLPEEPELTSSEAFVAAACLDYAEHGPRPEVRIATARQMLMEDPSLAQRSVAALATTGDHEGLRAVLEADPVATNQACGPNGWPPLLYATYSRIQPITGGAINTARVLLEAGADPNAGFLWRGLVPPFTALTGAMGGGEPSPRPVNERLEMMKLLLDAGADPNDGQGLYNCGLGGDDTDDPAYLELLVEYGLGTTTHGPWYQLLGDRLADPSELLYDHLEVAAKKDRPKTMSFLLGLGLDGTRNVGRSQLPPARIAAAKGHGRILTLLAESGIAISLTPVELALACIRSGDVSTLEEQINDHPELADQLRTEHPGACADVPAGHGPMLHKLLALRFDINDRSTTKTPLHHAAEAGDTERARMLIEHGADANLLDTHIGATPWGWANHGGHSETAAYLAPLTKKG